MTEKVWLGRFKDNLYSQLKCIVVELELSFQMTLGVGSFLVSVSGWYCDNTIMSGPL